ncbi:hypothetical protein F4776DRAFT_632038 [Hypoxylon sp. NC0597]|nr:hypothetical protein F4776DRAFT_632038 [Hypoxylon sp. NC0597]
MSFVSGVGDFIAGANLAHELIRVMTETRATAEYQEALAEVCGIQRIFIQLTQLCRKDIWGITFGYRPHSLVPDL